MGMLQSFLPRPEEPQGDKEFQQGLQLALKLLKLGASPEVLPKKLEERGL